MTKTRSTKSALLCSVLSLLLCTAMLLGTTYAWFTDGTSTGANRIAAGNLDVTLSHRTPNGDFCEVQEDTALFLSVEREAIQWEPGAAAEETFRISNDGTLALQYSFFISFANAVETPEGKTLADALSIRVIRVDGFAEENGSAVGGYGDPDAGVPLKDFLFTGSLLAGESQTFRVVIDWVPGEADNDFNLNNGRTGKNGEAALSIDLGIFLEATQLPYEKDGYGSDYDANADLSVKAVYTFDQLKKALEEGGHIRVMEDIAFEDKILVDGEAVLDLNGKRLTIADPKLADPMIECTYTAHLTIRGNGTVDLEDHKSASFILPRGTLVVENGSFIRNRDPNAVSENEFGALFIGVNVDRAIANGAENANSTVVILDGYFDSGFCDPSIPRGMIIEINRSWGQSFLVYGGTYANYDPAKGDEGNGWQGWFFEGQTDEQIPAGYTVTESVLEDGRPVYTVHYEKP